MYYKTSAMTFCAKIQNAEINFTGKQKDQQNRNIRVVLNQYLEIRGLNSN